MTYEETLTHIYGLRRFGVRPGLERITALLSALGNPQERLRVVHVAGTNGKGSTAAFLASILDAGGCRTGLFTSPHLIRFTERFRVGGAEIGEETARRVAQRVLVAAPEGTTFFEVVTAMALLHFAEERVDIAILEAGMGGGSDATGAVSGILSVITPVALDHCEWLGDSVAKIAAEKAGIIRPGRPVVLAPQSDEALHVFTEQGRMLGSPLLSFGVDFSASWEETGLSYRGLSHTLSGLRPGIGGRYQDVNAAVALAASETLVDAGVPLTEAGLRRGIEEARWPGRMELFTGPPRILLDGAHNPAGAQALAASLGEISRRRIILVAGVMGDKDAAGILAPLLPLADETVAVTPAVERGLSSARLAAFCREMGSNSIDGGTVAEGLLAARSRAAAEDLILVCGSLFTVGEARAFLLSQKFEPFRG